MFFGKYRLLCERIQGSLEFWILKLIVKIRGFDDSVLIFFQFWVLQSTSGWTLIPNNRFWIPMAWFQILRNKNVVNFLFSLTGVQICNSKYSKQLKLFLTLKMMIKWENKQLQSFLKRYCHSKAFIIDTDTINTVTRAQLFETQTCTSKSFCDRFNQYIYTFCTENYVSISQLRIMKVLWSYDFLRENKTVQIKLGYVYLMLWVLLLASFP